MGEQFPQGIAALPWSSLRRQQTPQTLGVLWGTAGIFITPSPFLKGAGTRIQIHAWRSHYTTVLCQENQAPTTSCGIWGGGVERRSEDTGPALGFTCSHSCSTQCAGQFLSPHGCTARGLVAGSHCELEITLPSRLRHATKRLMRPSPHGPEHLESKRHLDTSESRELERSGLVVAVEESRVQA